MKTFQSRAFRTKKILITALLLGGVTAARAALPAPLVEVDFDGATGTTIENLGSLAGTGELIQADSFPEFSTAVPTGDYAPANNTGSVNFGTIAAGQGGRAIDLTTTGGDGTLGALTAFTITGWLNPNDLQVGFGGNRIVFALESPNGPGIDFVHLANGAFRIGINQWPDDNNRGGGGPSSSSGILQASASNDPANWVFFAVTYDSTAESENLKYYFGSPTQLAGFDSGHNYKGPLETDGAIPSSGHVTLGNFGTVVGARDELGLTGSRVFRGLMDEIRIWDSALTLGEIQSAQIGGATAEAPVVFLQQPASQTVFAGAPVTLSAPATGSAPISYQWQRDDTDIPGATNETYLFTPTVADSGTSFRVVASNSLGPVTSSNAVFTVLPENNHKLSLSFSGGATVTNLGNLGGGGNFVQSEGFPAPSSAVPEGPFAPTDNIGSVDFGAITGSQGGHAIDLTNNFGGGLGPMSGFTLSGWLNSVDIEDGPGGNRILFALAGGAGLDLVQLADGSLQLGVNQFPDNSPARSSAGWITADPAAGNNNWVFFAVTYDGSAEAGNVQFYFGTPSSAATPDFAPLDYSRGIIRQTGTATVGNFATSIGARTATGNQSRVFRGLMDEINLFNRVLTFQEILDLQTRPAYQPATAEPVQFTQQPQDAVVFENQTATFSAAFSGTPPFTIQWQRAETDIPGEINPTLEINATLADNGAQFRAVVSNAAGSVTSQAATLEVREDTGQRVSLSFSEGSGTTTANSADLAGSGVFDQADGFPVFSSNVPAGTLAPPDNTASIDFGTIADGQGGRAIDFTNPFGNTLGSMDAFTITGWLNSRDITDGPGGNRIVFGLATGNGPGLDLVQLEDGSLQLGVNQWPDNTPARSSAGWITPDPEAGAANWVFFAVSYDGTLDFGNVHYYFGNANQPAALDFAALDYPRGPIETSGALTVANFSGIDNNARNATGNNSRVFRGLMDEIRIFSEALTLEEILEVQKAAPAAPPATGAPQLAVSRSGNELVLQWDSATAFQVEATASLSGPQWTPVNITPEQNGNARTVRIPIGPDAQFFRLASN